MATKITSTEVQETIAALRQKQSAEWEGLKEQWAVTSPQLAPGHLVSNAIGEAVGIPKLGKKIATAAAGFAIQKLILPNKPWVGLLSATSALVLGNRFKKKIDNAKLLGKIILKKLVSGKKDNPAN